tara:strand:+ start:3449 stop:3982 length:534 start_codon:yes stop_codon:yes gene_type:complete
MKIIKNVLTKETLDKARLHLQKNIGAYKWSSSEILWNSGLRIGTTGSTLVQETPQWLRDLLIPELNKVLPEYHDININYHLWQRGSGISAHTDLDYIFGATLYLNEEWHMNYGGLFVWQPKGEDTLRAIIPEGNTLVLNDDSETHMVTPVSMEATQYRVTLQIWGKHNPKDVRGMRP